MEIKTGLRQRIASATSKNEVDALLNEGKTYEFAVKRTRSSWRNTANRVLGIKVVSSPDEENFSSNKKQKRKKS